MGRKYTEAQKQASVKYLSEKTDSIQIRVPKGKPGEPGTKDRWKAVADAQGVSLQRFIINAVEAAVAAQGAEK